MKEFSGMTDYGGHCSIVEGEFLKDDNCLRLEYQSDGPCDEFIDKLINSRFPELSNKEIKFTYTDPAWLSDWNMGNPTGCFGLVLVFFFD